jgi:hypothetical protein
MKFRSNRAAAISFVMLGSFACMGTVVEEDAPADPVPDDARIAPVGRGGPAAAMPAAPPGQPDPGRGVPVLRRLSRDERSTTFAALTAKSPAREALPEDPRSGFGPPDGAARAENGTKRDTLVHFVATPARPPGGVP